MTGRSAADRAWCSGREPIFEAVEALADEATKVILMSPVRPDWLDQNAAGFGAAGKVAFYLRELMRASR